MVTFHILSLSLHSLPLSFYLVNEMRSVHELRDIQFTITYSELFDYYVVKLCTAWIKLEIHFKAQNFSSDKLINLTQRRA